MVVKFGRVRVRVRAHRAIELEVGKSDFRDPYGGFRKWESFDIHGNRHGESIDQYTSSECLQNDAGWREK